MKVPATAAVLAAMTVVTATAQAQDAAAACTSSNLNTGVKLAQSDFYRAYHNQDLVKAISQLRRDAEADMARGDMQACGLKATTIQAMLEDPAGARVTLSDYQSRAAAQTGQSVQSTLTVGEGRKISQQQLMGMPLKSLNSDTLGTITGVINSANGRPLYVTVTPSQKMQATTPVSTLTVPVSMLLVNDMKQFMYVALSTQDFWNEARFRDNAAVIQPAG
ncbi:MAG: hypothetical protein DI628_05150 [Blastochloris viridis]|uniref:PRC-barrel domain-containing protein n=1 Tax=Blastochloris viridis TaxID=1079 RepID=A0A6N4RFC1_BLAVI|nr:MAG: hypothetical protein DI628_05150 [Blastochloris viridis]